MRMVLEMVEIVQRQKLSELYLLNIWVYKVIPNLDKERQALVLSWNNLL